MCLWGQVGGVEYSEQSRGNPRILRVPSAPGLCAHISVDSRLELQGNVGASTLLPCLILAVVKKLIPCHQFSEKKGQVNQRVP